jgi:putative serine/threonine protein kinase
LPNELPEYKKRLRMKIPAVVPIDFLPESPYSQILCFPNPSENEIQSRIQQLQTQGVTALEFTGNASVFGVQLPVLGKGFVGIVVIGHLKGERIAVKIRRLDSGRSDLLHEADMLSKANSVGVGPKLIGASKDFLLMQLIDGCLLADWLRNHSEKKVAAAVIREILEQCYQLDNIRLDHGELSKAPKHVIVDLNQKPFLVDFETSSIERRVANVSAMCQFLFTGSSVTKQLLDEILGANDRQRIIEALRKYKKSLSRLDFDLALKVCLKQA